MATYQVTKVSQQEPRVWDNPKGGKVYYIKCMLSGHDRPVAIGKKAPDSIKVGDTVNGTITPDPSHEEDKFKADPVAFGGSNSGGGKSNYTPPDTHAIAKSVSLKAAVDHFPNVTTKDVSVLDIADQFLAWLEADNKATPSDEPRYENSEGF